MVKEKSIDKYNFDNRFSVRFQLSDDKILKHIPDNIFMVEMPVPYSYHTTGISMYVNMLLSVANSKVLKSSQYLTP